MTEHDFDGATYDPDRDRKPLNRQYQAVETLMADRQWRTLAEIAEATGYPQASVSARLRDMRKQRFGGQVVVRRPRAGRLYEYYVGDDFWKAQQAG
jgi:DNA-binding transcriptional regulator GbsR (MarR family)